MAEIVQYRDVSQWLQELSRWRDAVVASGWGFVDVLREGIDQFGGRDRDKVADLYELASQQTGVSVKTLQNYVSVARSFPPERRPDGIEMGHCDAVLGLPEGQQDELLHEAAAHGYSVSYLRRLAWQRKQTALPVNGNGDVPFPNGGERWHTCPQCGHEFPE